MMATAATEPADPFITDVTRLMEQEDADAVTQFFEDDLHRTQLIDRAWDVLGMLTAHACDEPVTPVDPAFHRICDYLVRFLASKVKPKEFLVMALEQIEQFKADAKFRLFLDPLRTCLTRIGIDKFHSVDFVMGALYAHLRSLRPLPVLQQQKWDNERELAVLHNDPAVQRLNALAADYVAFVGDLVALSRDTALASLAVGGYRKSMMRHLVALLEWPLTYTDFVTHAEDREEGEGSTEAFRVLNLAFGVAAELAHHDVHRFVQHALRHREVAGMETRGEDEEEEREEEEAEAGVEDTRYSAKGLLVLLYCAHFPHPMLTSSPALPQVLAPLFSLHFALPFVLAALAPASAMQGPETLATRTALALLRQLLSRILDASLAAATLEQDCTGRVLSRLMALVAYHESRLVRHLALRCLTRWFWVMRGREGKWRFFLHVWRRSDHAGLRGHFVKLVKDQTHLSLRWGSQEGSPDDFCGPHGMDEMLRTIATGAMPHGATTDLLEQQDVLLPALNLFYYLGLSDTENRSGLWRLTSWLDDNLVEPMRTALNMSRAHYRHRVNTNDEDEVAGGDANGATAEVTVGGVSLPQMTKEEKLEVYQSALVRFDLIESVLGQLTSVIAAKRPPTVLPVADGGARASVEAIG